VSTSYFDYPRFVGGPDTKPIRPPLNPKRFRLEKQAFAFRKKNECRYDLLVPHTPLLGGNETLITAGVSGSFWKY
jgi:hypothetical protein